ncbi:MAG: HAD family phosphatase [Erysipelotrichaceae bacterium]
MIKNVIFDIGNVLIDFQPDPYYKEMIQDHELRKHLCDIIFHSPEWLAVDEGTLDYGDCEQILIKQYPEDAKNIKKMISNWMNMMVCKDEELAYAYSLQKAGYKIYLLSNLSAGSHDYISNMNHFFDDFDGMILSYQVGLVKPDAEIYKSLLRKYELRSNECIFIDDLKANIEQAIALGIHGVVFHDFKQVKEDIERFIEEEAC